MTKEEKENFPEHKTTGGFLRKHNNEYKKQWAVVWKKCTKEEKQSIKDLPNFNADIFKEITGIKI